MASGSAARGLSTPACCRIFLPHGQQVQPASFASMLSHGAPEASQERAHALSSMARSSEAILARAAMAARLSLDSLTCADRTGPQSAHAALDQALLQQCPAGVLQPG